MSVTTTDRVRCRQCETENDPAHTYCGVCGQVLDALLEPAVAKLGGRRRAYPWLLVISGALFVLSAVVAMAAAFATTQAGPWDVGFGVADELFDTNLGSGGGDSSIFVAATLMLSFAVAVLSLLVFLCAAVRLVARRARGADHGEARRRAAEAAETGKRAAAAVLERGGQEYAEVRPKVAEAARKGRKRLDEEYAEAKPKVAAAARKGRKRFDEDVAPRVGKAAAEAGRAAAKGRAWMQERRDRSSG